MNKSTERQLTGVEFRPGSIVDVVGFADAAGLVDAVGVTSPRMVNSKVDPSAIAPPAANYAHAMLSVTRLSMHVNGWGDAVETGLADGIAGSETAIDLDAEEPLGHFAHALGLQYAGRLEKALAAGERAVAIDANSSRAHAVVGSTGLLREPSRLSVATMLL